MFMLLFVVFRDLEVLTFTVIAVEVLTREEATRH